jgi:hypothetical protein
MGGQAVQPAAELDVKLEHQPNKSDFGLDRKSNPGGSTLVRSCDLLDGDRPVSEASRVSGATALSPGRHRAAAACVGMGVVAPGELL